MGEGGSWKPLFEQLEHAGRAATLQSQPPLWIAAERLPMLAGVFPGVACTPTLTPPERDRARAWTREDALRELVRGRLEAIGPTTAPDLARALGVSEGDIDLALVALEHEGFVLRGRFTPGMPAGVLEWCERRLLARIHRYTLDRLRREIAAVPAADYMRFLLRWQRLTEDTRAAGPEGLAAVLDLLDGFELPAGAWESDVLPARLADYDPLWLDGLTACVFRERSRGDDWARRVTRKSGRGSRVRFARVRSPCSEGSGEKSGGRSRREGGVGGLLHPPRPPHPLPCRIRGRRSSTCWTSAGRRSSATS